MQNSSLTSIKLKALQHFSFFFTEIKHQNQAFFFNGILIWKVACVTV